MIACDYYYSARMDSKKKTVTTDTFCRGTLPSSPVCGSHSSDRGLRTSLPTSPATVGPSVCSHYNAVLHVLPHKKYVLLHFWMVVGRSNGTTIVPLYRANISQLTEVKSQWLYTHK